MLSRIYARLMTLLKKEDGPTAVEYAIMLALILLVCIIAIQILGKNTNTAYGKIGASISAVTTAS